MDSGFDEIALNIEAVAPVLTLVPGKFNTSRTVLETSWENVCGATCGAAVLEAICNGLGKRAELANIDRIGFTYVARQTGGIGQPGHGYRAGDGDHAPAYAGNLLFRGCAGHIAVARG